MLTESNGGEDPGMIQMYRLWSTLGIPYEVLPPALLPADISKGGIALKLDLDNANDIRVHNLLNGCKLTKDVLQKIMTSYAIKVPKGLKTNNVTMSRCILQKAFPGWTPQQLRSTMMRLFPATSTSDASHIDNVMIALSEVMDPENAQAFDKLFSEVKAAALIDSLSIRMCLCWSL
jgi:hypothetical protein